MHFNSFQEILIKGSFLFPMITGGRLDGHLNINTVPRALPRSQSMPNETLCLRLQNEIFVSELNIAQHVDHQQAKDSPIGLMQTRVTAQEHQTIRQHSMKALNAAQYAAVRAQV
jgi:hypothetical protein